MTVVNCPQIFVQGWEKTGESWGGLGSPLSRNQSIGRGHDGSATYELGRGFFQVDLSSWVGDYSKCYILFDATATQATGVKFYAYDWGGSLDAGDWLASYDTPITGDLYVYQGAVLAEITNMAALVASGGKMVCCANDETSQPYDTNSLVGFNSVVVAMTDFVVASNLNYNCEGVLMKGIAGVDWPTLEATAPIAMAPYPAVALRARVAATPQSLLARGYFLTDMTGLNWGDYSDASLLAYVADFGGSPGGAAFCNVYAYDWSTYLDTLVPVPGAWVDRSSMFQLAYNISPGPAGLVEIPLTNIHEVWNNHGGFVVTMLDESDPGADIAEIAVLSYCVLLLREGTPPPESVGGYAWRARFARFNTPWSFFSDWTEYDYFSVSQVGSIPVCHMEALRAVMWELPTIRWTYDDIDGDTQTALQVQIATDSEFSNIVFDSGEIQSTELFYHIEDELDYGFYYVRLKIQTAGIDWSEWEEDSFTYAEPTSQDSLFDLFRQHPDGVLSRIYVPLSSVVATQKWNAPSEFEFVINNLYPFPEERLVSCHHFDEISGSVAHDIFGPNDIALSGVTWDDVILNLSGGAYGVSKEISIALDGDFTAVMVINGDAGSSGFIWYLGDSDTDTNFYAIVWDGTNNVQVITNDTGSDDLYVEGWCILALQRSGSDLNLIRVGGADNSSVSISAPGSISGSPHLGLGCFAGGGINNVVDQAQYAGHLLYSMALDDPRLLFEPYKNFNSHRGVVIPRWD